MVVGRRLILYGYSKFSLPDRLTKSCLSHVKLITILIYSNNTYVV